MLQVSSGELWEPVKHVQPPGMGLGKGELCCSLLPPHSSLAHGPVS